MYFKIILNKKIYSPYLNLFYFKLNNNKMLLLINELRKYHVFSMEKVVEAQVGEMWDDILDSTARVIIYIKLFYSLIYFIFIKNINYNFQKHRE